MVASSIGLQTGPGHPFVELLQEQIGFGIADSEAGPAAAFPSRSLYVAAGPTGECRHQHFRYEAQRRVRMRKINPARQVVGRSRPLNLAVATEGPASVLQTEAEQEVTEHRPLRGSGESLQVRARREHVGDAVCGRAPPLLGGSRGFRRSERPEKMPAPPTVTETEQIEGDGKNRLKVKGVDLNREDPAIAG